MHLVNSWPHKCTPSQVQEFTSSIQPIVRMVPLRFFIPSPFGMVEVLLLLRLIVRALASRIFVDSLIYGCAIGSIVEIVLNVISLPHNGVAQCLVRGLHLLKHFRSLMHLRLCQPWPLKIWMVFLSHFIIRMLNLFLRKARFGIQYSIKVGFFLLEMKHDCSSLKKQIWASFDTFYEHL